MPKPPASTSSRHLTYPPTSPSSSLLLPPASTFRPCSFLRGRIPSSGLPWIICIIAFFNRHTNEPTFTAFAPSPPRPLPPVSVRARARARARTYAHAHAHAHARTHATGGIPRPDVVLCWTCESLAVISRDPRQRRVLFYPSIHPAG